MENLADPEVYLRGENLEYYRNIEYLKEMTKQATALISRSNAMYNNILMDDHIGVKARGLSISDDNRSLSPDFGRCEKCGIFHGATGYCIVELIAAEEEIKSQETPKPPRKMTSKASIFRKLGKVEETKVVKTFELPRLGTMSPDEVLEMYEVVSARYGAANGRRFLYAQRLSQEPPKEIEPWTTPSNAQRAEHSKIKYKSLERECLGKSKLKEYMDPLCPELSKGVRQKFNQIVTMVPPCQVDATKHRKQWSAFFRHQNQVKVKTVQSVIHVESGSKSIEESPESPTQCACGILNCFCGKSFKCEIPVVNKNCLIASHDTNNHLLIVRQNLEKRRLTKSRRFTEAGSKTTVAFRMPSRDKNVDYNKMSRVEQFKSLSKCIGDAIPEILDDHATFRKVVRTIADFSSPLTTPNVYERDRWQKTYANLEMKETSDGQDSLESEIYDDESELSDQDTADNIDYRAGSKLFPSRIPWAQEVYSKVNNLFDKMSAKFEKSIFKNSNRRCFTQYRETSTELLNEMFVSVNNQLLQTLRILQFEKPYMKQAHPFHVRQKSKIKRLNNLLCNERRVARRREMIERCQLGKALGRVRKSKFFTPEQDFIGFRPYALKLLKAPEPTRFQTCDLSKRGVLTTKKIHHDYRLVSKLFDNPPNCSRESMMDAEMLDRLKKYKRTMQRYKDALPRAPESEAIEEESDDETSIKKFPLKEEERFVFASRNETNLDDWRKNIKMPERMLSSAVVSTRLEDLTDCLSLERKLHRESEKRSTVPDKCSKWLMENPLTTVPNEYISSGHIDDNKAEKSKSSNRSESSSEESWMLNERNKERPDPVHVRQKRQPQASFSFSPIEKSADGIRRSSTTKIKPPTKVKPSRLHCDTDLNNFVRLKIDAQHRTPLKQNELKLRAPRSKTDTTVDQVSPSQRESRRPPSAFRMSRETPEQEPRNQVLSKTNLREPSKLSVKAPSSAALASTSNSILKNRVRENVKQGSLTQTTSLKWRAPDPCPSPAAAKTLGEIQLSNCKSLVSMSSILIDGSRPRVKKNVSLLGQTKKRSFGVDIGQGINYIQYLKNNAVEADAEKRAELVDILCTPPAKPKPPKPKIIKPSSNSDLALTQSSRVSTATGGSASVVLFTGVGRKSKVALMEDNLRMPSSENRLDRQMNFKTLDEIFKEAHGINKKNTPSPLVDNEYEFESHKKQQLKKHRLD